MTKNCESILTCKWHMMETNTSVESALAPWWKIIVLEFKRISGTDCILHVCWTVGTYLTICKEWLNEYDGCIYQIKTIEKQDAARSGLKIKHLDLYPCRKYEHILYVFVNDSNLPVNLNPDMIWFKIWTFIYFVDYVLLFLI